jgi:ParB-like chromosome segregation protein Spo0J
MAKTKTDKPWPASETEVRATVDLKPCKTNAKVHSKAQVSQIADSIVEWGWTTAILVDESDVVICGHGRLLAAKQLGLAKVPVTVARGWSEAQITAYRIADNKLAENAQWDHDMLATEFARLEELDFDLTLAGFDQHAETERPSSVSPLALPKATKIVWALVGVPIEFMGQLQRMIDEAKMIDGSVVEVCEER